MSGKFFQFIHGNSELLINEHRLDLLNKARKHNYDQIERITVEANFNWQHLLNDCQTQDLWSEKKVLDINNHINKLDRQATAALIELAEKANKELLVIVCCGKLTSSQTKAKWYQQLDKLGQCTQVRAPFAKEYPNWLVQRAKQSGIRLTAQASNELAQLTQGNLLAGHQAIEKAKLLELTTLDRDDLKQVISDCAQFQVFDLADALLLQQPAQCLRMLENLKQQNTEATLVLWSLSQTCRQLLKMKAQVQQGQSMQQVLAKQWASKRPLYQSALSKLNYTQLSKLMQQCHQIDLIIKSSQSLQSWQHMMQWCVQFCMGR